MIKATWGLTQEPFYRNEGALLLQQAEAMEMIKIHAQHGGFSVLGWKAGSPVAVAIVTFTRAWPSRVNARSCPFVCAQTPARSRSTATAEVEPIGSVNEGVVSVAPTR
jgi:hypothetical protein